MWANCAQLFKLRFCLLHTLFSAVKRVRGDRIFGHPLRVAATSAIALLLGLSVLLPRILDSPIVVDPVPQWIPQGDRVWVDLSGSFKTPDSQEVPLEDFRGKVLFLNLWAT